jgi:transposase
MAKNIFQLHGIDRSGKVVLRKALRRSQVPGFFSTLPPCLIGMGPARRLTIGRAPS